VQRETAGAVSIQRGELVVYRLLDVADRLDLAALESLLSSGGGASRLHLRPRGESFVMKNPPVGVPIGRERIQLAGASVEAEVHARFWDYGVLSVGFHIPIARGTEWPALVTMAAASESTMFHDLARERARSLMSRVAPAVQGAHEWEQMEDYTVFILEEIAGIGSAAELMEKADVPALILAEPSEVLAERQRRPVLDAAVQYATNDLAVIDWNSAVLVEPGGSRAVVEVIEFALAHLLEFRYYDELLDARLADLYKSVGPRKPRILGTDYRRASREASALFIELSGFIERVDNSLKFVGDLYLATIFRTAASRFRLQEWEQNVSRKIQLLGRVSDLLNGEVTARRGQLLEIIVVLLILFEVVWAIAH
jgi:hypothetical protein